MTREILGSFQEPGRYPGGTGPLYESVFFRTVDVCGETVEDFR